jgi:hypothetical protein
MAITVRPDLENELRANAEAEGMSVEDYIERLLKSGGQAMAELEALAIEGIDSGPAVEPVPGYWEQKHRQLDERLKSSR